MAVVSSFVGHSGDVSMSGLVRVEMPMLGLEGEIPCFYVNNYHVNI